TGTIDNNLVYANANQGIFIHRGQAAHVVNNTVVVDVASAVRLNEASQDVVVHNNVLTLRAGYAFYFDPDSQQGFNSNNNLFYLGSPLDPTPTSPSGTVSRSTSTPAPAIRWPTGSPPRRRTPARPTATRCSPTPTGPTTSSATPCRTAASTAAWTTTSTCGPDPRPSTRPTRTSRRKWTLSAGSARYSRRRSAPTSTPPA